MKKTIFLKKEIEVLIVSAGGVGTTFLMDAVGKYKKTNCSSNTDGYKHLPIPPISFDKNLRVIYVFGDPVLATISLFRRNYQRTQSIVAQKFQKPEYIIPEKQSLEVYLAQAKDGIGFERHFNNWRSRFSMYPTMFVKYGSLFSNLEALREFLDLPAAFVEDFPKPKARASSTDAMNQQTLEGLEKLYGGFQKELDQLPGFFTNENKAAGFKSRYLLSMPYRKALQDAFLKSFPIIRKSLNKVKDVIS